MLALQAFQIGQHQLCFDRFCVADRIDRAVNMGYLTLEAAQHVDDGVDLANIGQKLVAQPLAL